MNPVEIARLFHEEGWRDGDLIVAVAVCLGESEGDPRAFNGRGSDWSYGLMQINLSGALGPERRARYGLSSNEDLFDPRTNARVAYDIFLRAGSFSPWGAFTSGGYKKFGRYEKAQRAVAEMGVTLRYDRPSGYTSAIPPGTNALRYALAEHFGFTRTEVIRDRSRCQQQSSEHCVCRGIDLFTTDPVKGRKVFEFLMDNAAALGIQSVIFRDREWGFGNWTERHRSRRDHFDHVHTGLTIHASKTLTRDKVLALLEEDALMAITEARFAALEDKVDDIYVALFSKNAAAAKDAGRRGASVVDLLVEIRNRLKENADVQQPAPTPES